MSNMNMIQLYIQHTHICRESRKLHIYRVYGCSFYREVELYVFFTTHVSATLLRREVSQASLQVKIIHLSTSWNMGVHKLDQPFHVHKAWI